MKHPFVFVAVTAAMVLLSCHKSADNCTINEQIKTQDILLSELPPPPQQMPPHIENNISDTTYITGSPNTQVLQAGQPAPVYDWNKKIIKNAFVTIEVKDFSSYDRFIHQHTTKYGAYKASEQQLTNDGGLENTITIKVPVDRFEALMNALPSNEGTLIEKRITTQDVTGEVIDVKARTEAKKQVRNRYLDLLRQAKNMKDILEVQSEINSIQEDIEAGTGRAEYLLHQAAYSTIQLRYYQLPVIGLLPGQSHSFVTKIADAFNSGAAMLSGFVLLLVTLWPLLLASAIVWLVIKRLGQRSPQPIK